MPSLRGKRPKPVDKKYVVAAIYKMLRDVEDTVNDFRAEGKHWASVYELTLREVNTLLGDSQYSNGKDGDYNFMRYEIRRILDRFDIE